MPTEAELLQGIAANPHELDRWLILSDWLEDQGDPRAELARLRYLLHTEPEHPQREDRLTRQQELLDAGLSPVVPERVNSLGMRFALILPGTFQMGSPLNESGRSDNETLHTVELTKPFYLGVYPVTVGEFKAFAKAKKYKTEGEKEGDSTTWRKPGFAQTNRHPVVCVSWNDARAMVAWLNQTDKDGLLYALPTEAQWEYACRAGTQTPFWWGNDERRLNDNTWFSDNANGRTYPVETKKANPWGLYHMPGHVWEWCKDLYGDLSSAHAKAPAGASTGSSCVLRGGSWGNGARNCRSASRGRSDLSHRYAYVGFRLAVSLRS